MKPIRIFRHEDWIKPGRIGEYLDAKRIPWELVAIDQGETIPQTVDDVSGLVFLGGTMSVNDGYDWIEQELRLIRRAAEEDLPMLGHCLGSQLIAKGLGATVAPMAAKEIGWHRVRQHANPATAEWLAKVPEEFDVLVWHHDAFTLPPAAEPLYSSEHCREQAYARGNIVATVAHPEVTTQLLEEWLEIYGYDIEPVSASVQSIDSIRENIAERCSTMHEVFTDRLYDKWLEKVKACNNLAVA